MPFRAFRAVSRFVFHFVCLFFPFDTSQCLFNHSSDCFYLSGTRVKTLSFATRKLPPRRRSHIQPLLIPRFKDNPNFESGFTSRSLPLITNCLVILSAIFHPSPLFFFSLAPQPFPDHISHGWGWRWERGCSPTPQGSGAGAVAAGAQLRASQIIPALSVSSLEIIVCPYSLQRLFFWTRKSSPAADVMDSTRRFSFLQNLISANKFLP